MSSGIIYGCVVVFWAIIFTIAILLTRRSLRGVGEPLANEADETEATSANGHIQGTPTATPGSTPTGSAHN